MLCTISTIVLIACLACCALVMNEMHKRNRKLEAGEVQTRAFQRKKRRPF